VTKLIVSLDLKAASEASGLSVRSLQYAIDNDLLTVHYGGEKNSKPLIRPDDLDAYIRSLPKARPVKATRAA
jgi:hypothetical protein